jgi:UDP-glucose 4-epimerase
MIKNNKILISGGAGFLGSHVTEILCAKNRVTVIDDLSTGKKENIRGLNCKFIRAKAWGNRALELVRQGRFDYIIQLAANAYIKTSVERPGYDFDNNIHQPFHLLETLRKMKNRPRLLLASSAAVHGENIRYPMKEDDRLCPISPYGVGKLTIEHYANVYARIYNVPALSVRLYPMYGPRQTKQVFYDLMKKLAGPGNQIAVIGTGREKRDFTYVTDAARAIECILSRGRFAGGVVNLCTGKGTSIHRVVTALMAAMGTNKKARYTRMLRDGDVKNMIGSPRQLRALGYRPRIPLKEGIKRTVQWFLSLQG